MSSLPCWLSPGSLGPSATGFTINTLILCRSTCTGNNVLYYVSLEVEKFMKLEWYFGPTLYNPKPKVFFLGQSSSPLSAWSCQFLVCLTSSETGSHVPGTALELLGPPASTSQVLWLEVCVQLSLPFSDFFFFKSSNMSLFYLSNNSIATLSASVLNSEAHSCWEC